MRWRKRIGLAAVGILLASCGDNNPPPQPTSPMAAPAAPPATNDPVHQQCPAQARCGDGSLPTIDPTTCQVTVPCAE